MFTETMAKTLVSYYKLSCKSLRVNYLIKRLALMTACCSELVLPWAWPSLCLRKRQPAFNPSRRLSINQRLLSSISRSSSAFSSSPRSFEFSIEKEKMDYIPPSLGSFRLRCRTCPLKFFSLRFMPSSSTS